MKSGHGVSSAKAAACSPSMSGRRSSTPRSTSSSSNDLKATCSRRGALRRRGRGAARAPATAATVRGQGRRRRPPGPASMVGGLQRLEAGRTEPKSPLPTPHPGAELLVAQALSQAPTESAVDAAGVGQRPHGPPATRLRGPSWPDTPLACAGSGARGAPRPDAPPHRRARSASAGAAATAATHPLSHPNAPEFVRDDGAAPRVLRGRDRRHPRRMPGAWRPRGSRRDARQPRRLPRWRGRRNPAGRGR